MSNNLALGIAAVAAAAISAGLIVMLMPLLRRHAAALPNARSSHRTPTPQGAGAAVIAATLAAIAVIAGLVQPSPVAASLWLVIAATVFIALVGAVDDLRTIEVAPRLLLQICAVAVVIASLPVEARIVSAIPWWIERAMLLVACVWFVNLTNFMDGIDWMTAAEMVPVTVGLTVLGLLGALPSDGTIVALALCGALIGFMPFNRPVARIFLGDVGSLPIGLLVAWLLVLLALNGHLAAALILPLYYLADATLTLAQRIVRGEPFWQAHRTHFYQRATDRGFTVLEVVGRVFAVNAGLIVLAVASVIWPVTAVALATLLCAAALVGWLLFSFVRGRT
ncbi:MAG: glycosyltransferase family 4 protein [Alphaproteobacteria bacterium]|nr:glycosyltransferase family 4 protein [Alphaproteobacteria bacterium]